MMITVDQSSAFGNATAQQIYNGGEDYIDD
jgi:hypothetical protein